MRRYPKDTEDFALRQSGKVFSGTKRKNELGGF